jgi:hypothetical protein
VHSPIRCHRDHRSGRRSLAASRAGRCLLITSCGAACRVRAGAGHETNALEGVWDTGCDMVMRVGEQS